MKKKYIFLMLLIVFFVALIVSMSYAADAEPATIGDVFAGLFTDYVAPILGSALLILVMFYVKKLLSKLGITLSKEQEDYMNSVAEQLVRYAEEKAAKAVKESGDKITFTGSSKLAEVVKGLQEKFPKLTSEQANKIALAAVQKIPGIGLTGNT
jgi:hypothetical protein